MGTYQIAMGLWAIESVKKKSEDRENKWLFQKVWL